MLIYDDLPAFVPLPAGISELVMPTPEIHEGLLARMLDISRLWTTFQQTGGRTRLLFV